jgi:hypothetical protein
LTPYEPNGILGFGRFLLLQKIWPFNGMGWSTPVDLDHDVLDLGYDVLDKNKKIRERKSRQIPK